MTNASDWTGRVGDIWADEWRRTDRSFADLSRHLDAAILAAAPDRPFRALDIGCGGGGTTLALASARPNATIVAVDLSAALIDVARDRLAGLAGGAGSAVTLLAGDAIDLARAHAPFDLFYSRHGVMFFGDPVAAFTALHDAAAPGARLIFSCFREWSANSFAAAPAAALGLPAPGDGPGPFAFADRSVVQRLLGAAGWRDATATPIDFAYRVGAGADPVGDALGLLQRIGPAAAALRNGPDGERAAIVDRLRAVIEQHRDGDVVDFPAAAWIWSATA